MSQHYSDPNRESDAYSLPDVETFYLSAEDFLTAHPDTWMYAAMAEQYSLSLQEGAAELAGWYYWFCLPGCLPDSEPSGPYATEAEALAEAQQDAIGILGYE